MYKRENRISLMAGIPGLVLQIVGVVLNNAMDPPHPFGLPISLVGTVLLLISLAYYAMAKGRSPAWGLMGFLSWIGILVLALLKDRSTSTEAKARSQDEY